VTEERSEAAELGRERDLGKVYDTELIKRLWPFMRPYRGWIAFNFAMIPPRAALELMPALVVGAALARGDRRGRPAPSGRWTATGTPAAEGARGR